MLEEERRRREEAEKRLQEETVHRQQLIEKEVKMRSKNFSQVRSHCARVHWDCTRTVDLMDSFCTINELVVRVFRDSLYFIWF